MKKTVLRSYAKLIAACGVNIQKGQEVFIQAELDQPEFVTMLVEECYKLKAKKVVVFKYRPKKDSKSIRGHRQPYTKVQIEKIVG